MTFSFGPSLVEVTQGVVTGLELSEVAAPYTTIRVDAVTASEQVVNSVTGHLGVDATYMITPQIGAGLFLRHVGGSADIPTLGGDVSVDVGGVQTGGGSGSGSRWVRRHELVECRRWKKLEQLADNRTESRHRGWTSG